MDASHVKKVQKWSHKKSSEKNVKSLYNNTFFDHFSGGGTGSEPEKLQILNVKSLYKKRSILVLSRGVKTQL